MISLSALGYSDTIEQYRKENHLLQFDAGLIISEHKERYIVKMPDGEYEGEITGNLRFAAISPADFPAVGDWVSVARYDEDKVIIYNILPRRNCIERQAVGKFGEKQIIASNIDYAFIMQSADRDFSINRIERYLTICYDAGVSPIILINKIDLTDADGLESIKNTIAERAYDLPILFISNATKEGFQDLIDCFDKGKTYCLLGSSGVGKSTLINELLGESVLQTKDISLSTKKGMHTTTHRQLFILENGALIIDNPGMREVGIANDSLGLKMTFDSLNELAQQCKFKDCTHTEETHCAIIEAVEQGDIDKSLYKNYIKLAREQQHFERNVNEKRKKDKKFGKMIKQVKKDMKEM